MKKKTNRMLLFGSIVATSIHCLNHIYSAMGTAKKIIETENDIYYDWRFGKIRYSKKGQGTPLLLIHNETMGSSSYEYQGLIHLLSNQYEVYAIDLLGYGLSEKTDITYTNYLYVELIKDFIQSIIGKKTDVIVSGQSSSIIIEAAMQNENMIRKIMMINPPDLYQMNAIPSKQTKFMNWLIKLPIIGTFIYHIIVSQSLLEKQLINDYFYDSRKIKENDILAYIESANMGGQYAKYTLSSFYGKYMNTNIIQALKTINHSIMIIGNSENKNQKNIIDNYIYYNASIEYVEIPKTKMLPHLESPQTIFHLAEIFFH